MPRRMKYCLTTIFLLNNGRSKSWKFYFRFTPYHYFLFMFIVGSLDVLDTIEIPNSNPKQLFNAQVVELPSRKDGQYQKSISYEELNDKEIYKKENNNLIETYTKLENITVETSPHNSGGKNILGLSYIFLCQLSRTLFII